MESTLELEWEQMDPIERGFWRLLYLKQEKPEDFIYEIEDIEKSIGEENTAARRMLTAFKQAKVSEDKLALLFGLRIMAPDKFVELLDKLVQRQIEADDEA